MNASVNMVNNAGIQALVPAKDKLFVPFGQFDDLYSIINSKMFYTVFITGLSGNGKTKMVEQVCAKTGRPMIRVSITAETDEDDLLGGFRLTIDPETGAAKTTFHAGPVVVAMEMGAVLLLDEVDLGSSKLMCLQPVLEGNSVFLKKINRRVTPAPGFNVIATANTKGRGDDEGKFVGTNIMNEAFLERFAITIEQDYPPDVSERKILETVAENIFTKVDEQDREFFGKLVKWARMIRETYKAQGIDDVISTRRLIAIVNAYNIFQRDKRKALLMCLNRFDKTSKDAFLDFYSKVDDKAEDFAAEAKKKNNEDLIPF